MNPAQLNALEARRQIGAGELTSTELTEACLAVIEAVDPAVNAMIGRADDVRDQAARADEAVRRGAPLGALHGLPVAIKDIQATAGIPTTFGSAAHAQDVPHEDAGIVARIRAAGGIVIGKTNVPEFSIGANTVNRLFGATGNPFAVDLTCGGSSGGSAVAVATHMAPLATGSDHGGSLRIPASYCGVVGFRATPGVVPNEQRSTAQTNYSVQGPMARTVADCALLLSVIASRTEGASGDPMAFPLETQRLGALDPCDPSRLRIGVSEDLGGVLVSRTIRQLFRDRIERFARRVDRCEPCAVDLRDAPDVDWHLRQELFLGQWQDAAARWDADFNPNIRATYEAALATPLEAVARARRRQVELYREFRRAFDTCDVLICPAVAVPPFPWRDLNPRLIDDVPVENYMGWLALTSSLTVVGHPVVALPCGVDDQGTPFGLQVVGPAYSDHRLLTIAQALEEMFQTDAALARPRPDLDALAATPSSCRTEGRQIGRT